jgi:ribonuclease P protein component
VDFRKVYADGFRVSSPFFAAFCLRLPEPGRSRIGLTVPRALGNAVVRNRIKRRMREAVRKQLHSLEPQWQIVLNPRRASLAGPMPSLEQEVGKLFSRCKGS